MFTADLTMGAQISSQHGGRNTGDRVGVQLDRAGVGSAERQARPGWFQRK